MKIFVHRAGGNLGPYSEFDLRSMVQAGLIKSSELGWQEGMTEWRPLSTFVTLDAPVTPAALASPPPISESADEATRRRYLNAEGNVRSIAIFYYIACFGTVILAPLLGRSHVLQAMPAYRALPFVLIALAVVYFWMAQQIRRLNPAVIVPATLVAVLGMFQFPAGTLINAIILWSIHSPKGRHVFTPEYHALVERTPSLRWKMSLAVRIFLGLCVLGLLALAGLLALSKADLR